MKSYVHESVHKVVLDHSRLMATLDAMNIYNAILPYFFFLIGVTCLLIPQKVQKFVLTFNEKMGHVEEPNSFRRSDKYIFRLRKLGVFTILGGAIVLLIDLFAEDLVRVVI